jgi:phenylpyruvate tautomerase PptA (4-oxalocrotonate tautomerase family)
MEYVGEAVADVIGLNDSVFQDVIDEMHDEDWKRAVDVHTEREAEEQEEFSSCAIIDPAVPLGDSNL